jgi:hypothetical protein
LRNQDRSDRWSRHFRSERGVLSHLDTRLAECLSRPPDPPMDHLPDEKGSKTLSAMPQNRFQHYLRSKRTQSERAGRDEKVTSHARASGDRDRGFDGVRQIAMTSRCVQSRETTRESTTSRCRKLTIRSICGLRPREGAGRARRGHRFVWAVLASSQHP